MKIKEVMNEALITEPAFRLSKEAIKEFGKKTLSPKQIYKKYLDSIANDIKKEKVIEHKNDIINAIKELRK